MKFKKFYVDTNQSSGLVKSVHDWKKIVQMLKDAWQGDVTAEYIMKHLLESNEEKNVFGRDVDEHTGITLAEWAKENGMYDILKIV